MKWIKIQDEGATNLVAIIDGQVHSADHNHPHFDEILEWLVEGYYEEEGTDELVELFDYSTKVESFFEQISSRVTLRGDQLFFDDKPVNNVLADHVIKSIKEGNDDHMPFVKFWEKVESNPNRHSREHLLNWLMASDFTITPEGDIIGFKGVRDDYTSVHAGPGVVNGESQDGHLDNTPGNEVEVARSYVTFDPADGCNKGLHVGTWGYADNFGFRTLEVHVDPADVVSVPTDCHDQKMRVCKYKVIRELTEAYDLSVLV